MNFKIYPHIALELLTLNTLIGYLLEFCQNLSYTEARSTFIEWWKIIIIEYKKAKKPERNRPGLRALSTSFPKWEAG